MVFQDDLALKKPEKPSTTIDQSSRRLLVVWGLILVFILKELSVGARQTIPKSFALTNQNCLYISTTYDPSVVYFDCKL